MRSSQELIDEHDLILNVLAALEDREGPGASGPVDLAFVRGFLEFSTLFVDSCHHVKEEQCLFPCLERCGIPRQGPIRVMLEEHEIGRGLIRNMTALCDRIETGEDLGDELRAQVVDYLGLLREHIDKETTILYPMGEGMMMDSDHVDMQAAYAKTEADLGPGEVARLRTLAEKLIAESQA